MTKHTYDFSGSKLTVLFSFENRRFTTAKALAEASINDENSPKEFGEFSRVERLLGEGVRAKARFSRSGKSGQITIMEEEPLSSIIEVGHYRTDAKGHRFDVPEIIAPTGDPIEIWAPTRNLGSSGHWGNDGGYVFVVRWHGEREIWYLSAEQAGDLLCGESLAPGGLDHTSALGETPFGGAITQEFFVKGCGRWPHPMLFNEKARAREKKCITYRIPRGATPSPLQIMAERVKVDMYLDPRGGSGWGTMAPHGGVHALSASLMGALRLSPKNLVASEDDGVVLYLGEAGSPGWSEVGVITSEGTPYIREVPTSVLRGDPSKYLERFLEEIQG